MAVQTGVSRRRAAGPGESARAQPRLGWSLTVGRVTGPDPLPRFDATRERVYRRSARMPTL
jgi:hypothetical protein